MDYQDADLDQYNRLYRAIEWSRRQLEPFRIHRMRALRQFVAWHYSHGGSDDRVPINLIRLAITIYLRLLVSNNPRAAISTKYRELRALAANMKAWEDWAIEEMNLGESLRTCAMDALFCMGIMKVGITDQGDPYADNIDLDDWVHDMRAKRMDKCRYMGHRFEMDLEVARNHPGFDKERREQLQAQWPSLQNESGSGGDERIKSLEMDSMPLQLAEFRDTVELWEIHLRDEQLILTCEYSPQSGCLHGKPLRVEPWVGPVNGPYHFLSFLNVPSNTMPSAPVSDWHDLHNLINRVFLKIGRQCDRQKTVTLVKSTATKDGIAIGDAEDGKIVPVDFPDQVSEVRYGGPDGPMVAFLTQAIDRFSWLAGNLDVVGGLSPQAGTLGQEEILSQNSSNQIKDQQDRMTNFTRSVLGAQGLAWYWWHLPNTYVAERKLPGVPFTTLAQVTPQERQGNFLKLNFDFVPYSLRGQTPAEQAMKVKAWLTQLVLPALPMMTPQGIAINWQAVFAHLAELEDMPMWNEYLTFAEPLYEQQPMQQPPTKPAATTRTSIRRNVPSGMGQGKNAALIQTLLGSGQPNDAARSVAV